VLSLRSLTQLSKSTQQKLYLKILLHFYTKKYAVQSTKTLPFTIKTKLFLRNGTNSLIKTYEITSSQTLNGWFNYCLITDE